MTDQEILIWYESLESATCNTDFPESAIIVRVRELLTERVRKADYSQWERGYGDGITGMGAVLAGAPLENLPEANREQARRWIDRHDAELRKTISNEGMEREPCGHFKSNLISDEHGHFTCDACKRDAELKAQTAAILREAAGHTPMYIKAGPDDPDWLIERGACSCGQLVADGITPWNKLWTDHILAIPTDQSALNAMMVAAVDRGFQAGQKEIAERMREATREEFVECDCDPEYAHHCFKCGGSGKIRKPVSGQAGAPEETSR